MLCPSNISFTAFLSVLVGRALSDLSTGIVMTVAAGPRCRNRREVVVSSESTYQVFVVPSVQYLQGLAIVAQESCLCMASDKAFLLQPATARSCVANAFEIRSTVSKG